MHVTSRGACSTLLSSALLLLTFEPAGAIVYNDALAAANGGASNYYDAVNLYPNVGQVLPVSCTATLINSRTVLTAAHCVTEETANGFVITQTAGTTVNFGANNRVAGLSVAASALIPFASFSFPAGDIALISLATPVTSITPVTLAQPGYTVAKGSTVTQVGYGGLGTGSSPPSSTGPIDGKRRVALTELGGYLPLANIPGGSGGGPLLGTGNNGAQLVYAAQFRNPQSPGNPDIFGLNALGIPVSAFEGGVAQGDSGGPLFYLDPTLGLVEIGTVIGGTQPAGSTGASNGYGETNAWTPVALFAAWIAANNPLQLVSANAGTFNWSNAAAWSGNVVPNNFQGIVENNNQPLGQVNVPRYYQVTLQNAGTINVDISPTIDTLTISNAAATLNVPTPSTLTSVVSTTITAGTMQLDGTHVTPLLSLNGGSAMLTGHGTLQGNVANTAGVVAPGGSGAIGALTINGNYSQGAAGGVAVRVAGTAADRLVVTGSATLAGGTLALAQASGQTAAPGATYSVLTAGQLTGSFATLNSGLGAALVPMATVTATGVSVTLAQLPFTSFATSPTTMSLARALGSAEAALPVSLLQSSVATSQSTSAAGDPPIPAGGGMLGDAAATDELDTLSAAQLANALNSIAPQGVYVQSDAARSASMVTADNIVTRLGNLRAGVGAADYAGFAMLQPPVRLADARDLHDPLPAGAYPPPPPLPAGVSTFLTGTVMFGTGSQNGTDDFTTAGLTAGADFAIGATGRIGISLTYANQGSAGIGGVQANTQTVLPVLYGSWSPGPFYLDDYVGGGWNTSFMRRQVVVGFEQATARANAGGSQLVAGVTAGLRSTSGALSYGPLLAFDYSHAWFNAINETGAGDFATSVDARGATSARGSIGARAEYHLDTAWGVLVPSLKAAYTHDFGDQRDTATARLQAAPAYGFTITGPGLTNDYATLAAGLATQLTRNISAGSVVETYIGHGVDTQLSLQATVSF